MNHRQILNIALKEFRRIFISPIAYIVLGVYVLLAGILFFIGIEGIIPPFFLWGQAELNFYFSMLPWLFPLFIPAITMGLISEEVNTGSYEILATLPVRTSEIILGKYLSVAMFVGILVLPTIPYAITVEIVGDLDWGPVIGGFIGAILLGMTYGAIGLFTSSLSKNQVVSLILAVAICLGLSMIYKMGYFLPTFLVQPLYYISTWYHFENISKGILDTRDLLFFLSLIVIFVYGSYIRMDYKSEK